MLERRRAGFNIILYFIHDALHCRNDLPCHPWCIVLGLGLSVTISQFSSQSSPESRFALQYRFAFSNGHGVHIPRVHIEGRK